MYSRNLLQLDVTQVANLTRTMPQVNKSFITPLNFVRGDRGHLHNPHKYSK